MEGNKPIAVMEELPETIQVTIRNKATDRSKDLIVYVSDDVNLYQHIYDNPSVHSAYVRTWSPNIVTAVKDGTSTIVCSVENTPIVFSLAQMKNTTTKQLYHHVSKVGSLSDITITLDVVQSDSLADKMNDDELGVAHEYSLVEEIPSELVLSNAIQTMNIKIQNQFTMRSIVLDIRISQEVYIFGEIYDNPALLQAQIRNWSSDIVTGIKSESKAIVASVSGTQLRLSMAKMKETSTKQLHQFVSQAEPRQHPELVLVIVESDQVPGIDAHFDLQRTSETQKQLEKIQAEEDEPNGIVEIVASDLHDSVDIGREDKLNILEGEALAMKGKDEETMQGSTDIETDSSIHEDDETVVAGNETPRTSPRSVHQISPNHQIPSIIMSSTDKLEKTLVGDTALKRVAALDFDDGPIDIDRKTSYDDFFVGDQAGFEITIDQSINNEFNVSIVEERFAATDEIEALSNENFVNNSKAAPETKNVPAAEEMTDATETQIEIEASFIPGPYVEYGSVGVESLAQTVEVVVHCPGDDHAQESVSKDKEAMRIASTKIQSVLRGNSVRSSQALLHDKASIIQATYRGYQAREHCDHVVQEKEAARIASTKIQSFVRGNAIRSNQSLRHDKASIIQAAFRGYQARKLCKHDATGVDRVKNIGRRLLAKHVQMKRELAASKIPQVVRSRASQQIAYFQRQRAKMQNFHSQEDMARKIQSAYRGHKIRSDIDSKHKATTKIQSVCRIWLTGQKVRKNSIEKQILLSTEGGIAGDERRPTAQAEATEGDDEEASLQATLIRLKAREDARLKAEEEAQMQATKEARTVADAQAMALANAEKAIATLEADEEARLKMDKADKFMPLEAQATALSDSQGFEVEYISASHELRQEVVQEAIYAAVAKDIISSTMREDIPSFSGSQTILEKPRSASDNIDASGEGEDAVVQLLSSVLGSPEAHEETQARHVGEEHKHQGGDTMDHGEAWATSKTATSKPVAKISEDDSDCRASKIENVSTGSESSRQETDDSIESKIGVRTMHSLETFGVDNTMPFANSNVSTAAPSEQNSVSLDDKRAVADGRTSNIADVTRSKETASATMVTMAGESIRSGGPNIDSQENVREKNSKQKGGVSISSQDSHTDTNSASLDTLDRLVIKSERKTAAVTSSQASHTDTNSTSLDTLDRMVLGVDSNTEPAVSSHSSEKRDESISHNSKAKSSANHDSALNLEQAAIFPMGSKHRKIDTSGSGQASSAAPLLSIVTTRNKDKSQASHPASVCSSLNTFPSYYEKFDSKIGSKMVLKALHTPVSEAKTAQDALILSDDDQSSKVEAASHISTGVNKDDIITLTARYEEFAKQLHSLVAQATVFHHAISEKEKARTKFFEECASMTDGTPLHLDVSKNDIPQSANISYARAQVEEFDTPRSMLSVQTLAQIYSSSSVTEYQQEILAYVTGWTEAVTSKVEAELQTYDKLEEQLYHYEVKVDDLRSKSKGNTSTKLTRNYKKLAVAGQKRDQQLSKTCYLLKAVVDNSWKDLYPLIEQTMVWETNRRDGQVDTMGVMLPKTMANMKQNIKSGKTMPAPEQESLERELIVQIRENRKLQNRINKLEAILQSDEWSKRNEMISKLSTFRFSSVGRKTAE